MKAAIAIERPDSGAALTLIGELDAYLKPLYPSASHHGFSPERLIAEDVAFFVARCGEEAAACGGVKLFGTAYGEVKRMYVRPGYRGRGLGKLILGRLEVHAAGQGIGVLRLETGVRQPEAMGLYERCGYRRRPPFGEYWDDPLSVFYEKTID